MRDCQNGMRCRCCWGWGHMAAVCPSAPPVSDLREMLEQKRQEADPTDAVRSEEGRESSSNSNDDAVTESTRL